MVIIFREIARLHARNIYNGGAYYSLEGQFYNLHIRPYVLGSLLSFHKQINSSNLFFAKLEECLLIQYGEKNINMAKGVFLNAG